MITPSFGLTATERVLPKLALDFTTASLDSRVTFTRALNTATRVNSSGYIETINADLPRFDYDPITLTCKGLLIEEARTNLLTYSEQFNNAVWTKTWSSIAENVIVAPDGALTGDKFIEDNTSGTHLMQQSASFTTGLFYTLTIYAKKAERSFIRLTLPSAAFTTGIVWVFNLDTGATTPISGTSGSVASAQSVGNGWWRVIVTSVAATATTNSNIQINISETATTNNYQGDGTSGLFIWGAQLEAGAFPTSYIPTTTTALTRNADVATMTGTNFSDWYNASEGALETKSYVQNPASVFATVVCAISDGTLSNRIQTLTGPGSGGNMNFQVTSGGSTQAQIIFGSLTVPAVHTMVGAYKENNFSASLDGRDTGTDTSGSIPVVDRMYIGGTAIGNIYNQQWIQKIFYWPYKLTNSEVQAFSK